MGEKRKEFTASIIFSTIGSLMGIVPYALIYWIIEYFLTGGKGADLGPVYHVVKIAFIVIAVRYIFVISSFVFSHIAAFDLLYDIRTRLTRHLGTLPMGYWSENNSGTVRKILHSDVESLENFMAHHVPDVVSGFVLPVATITYLFTVDWRLALVTLIPLVLGMVLMNMMMGMGKNSKRKVLMQKYHDSLGDMNSSTVEFVQGMPVVKAFGIVVDSFKKLKGALVNYRQLVILISKEQSAYWGIFSAVILGGGIFILPLGIYLLSGYQVSVATLLLFLILGSGCFLGFVNLIMITGHIERITEGIKRVQNILDEEPIFEPHIPATPQNNSIILDNVNFRYKKDAPLVLENINEKLEPGSFTAIVGPSGAGKTTLVHLMARMWDVEEGSIKIGGATLPELGTKGINSIVGTVFQDVQMLTDTVANNIAMGKHLTVEEIEDAARVAACYDFIKELPRGFDTIIGEGGEVHLSGGEKQRISLARVVAKKPEIVLLDEASSYADAENEYRMQEAFSKVTKDKTVVVIAHRLSTIVDADKILVVDEGRIKERGTHDELLELDGIYTKMWNAHTRAGDWTMDQKEA